MYNIIAFQFNGIKIEEKHTTRPVALSVPFPEYPARASQ